MTDERSSELAHYGVKGMRWGVRRYEKHDGNYTRKAVERFKKADKSYTDAASKLKKTKGAYKDGGATKQQLKVAKGNVKRAKRSMNASYKKLERSRRADIGKDLASQGKTITGNNKKWLLTTSAITAGTSIAGACLDKSGNKRLAEIGNATLFIGENIANSIIFAKVVYENEMLRAYYNR